MRVSDRYRRLGVVGAALVAMLIGGSTNIGRQDLTGLLAHQPGIAERARLSVLNGAFHTLKAAAFAWPTSSTLMPGSAIAEPPGAMTLAIDVNRFAKADRLNVAPEDMPDVDPAAGAGVSTGIAIAGIATTSTETGTGTGTGDTASGAGIGTDPYEVAESPDDKPHLEAPDMAALEREGIYSVSAGDPTGDPTQLEAALTPGADSDDGDVEISVPGDATAWSLDAALQGAPSEGPIYQQAAFIFGFDNDALPPQPFLHLNNPPAGGTTVAAKSGDAKEMDGSIVVRRGPSPAERLGLEGKRRERAQKCLAEAVYFESRGEPERGQIGVAQVVMNRVFSGYYPADICRAVYQNANRKLACQFTFACDNIRDVVTEPRLWDQAKRIASDMLDGQVWDAKVGRATHYHARSVRPYWIREMRKLDRIGEHTFYRPRRWTS